MKKRSGRNTIDGAKRMDKPSVPTGLPEYNTDSATGLYRLVYMVYAPEHPKGQGVIQVELPSKKEYKRVRRQIFMRRKLIRFTNSFGEPQLVQIGPNTISITTEKFEVKKVDPGSAQKSSIILPSQEAVSNLQ